jgi:hypothetical protein
VGGVLSLHVCRLCGVSLKRTLVDLGRSPLSRSYVSAEPHDEKIAAGPHAVVGHEGSAGEVPQVKWQLLRFVRNTAKEGRSAVSYGAPGRGTHCSTTEPGPILFRAPLTAARSIETDRSGGGRSSDSCVGSILNCEIP